MHSDIDPYNEEIWEDIPYEENQPFFFYKSATVLFSWNLRW